MLILSAGKNDHNQLGNRGSSGKALPILNPIKENTQLYEFEDEIANFSAGRSHNVIVLKNGTCYGWGCNMLYEIGLPKQKDYPYPTLISFRSFLSKYFFKEPFIVEALCGHSFTLYLDKAGIVYYALGNTDECSLQKINFSKEEIVSIHGYIQPCIIGKSGTIYTINDDLTAQPIPFKFTDKSDINDDDSEKIVDVCTTKKSIICLSKKGRVYMLSTLSGTLFTIVNSLINEKIIKVLGKTNNFFALSESGRIYTYDNEAEGELFSPLEFPSGTKIIDFSIGYDFTCFIDSENSLWCSGSKSFSSILGIKKSSFNKPEKSTLIESQKYKAMQVHCGYSHLLILAKQKTNSPSDQVQTSQQIPLSDTPKQPKQKQETPKQQNSTSPSRFRFPFFSSPVFGQNDKTEKNPSNNNNNDDDDDGDKNDSDVNNSSEINLQNYEILNKIKQLTDENKKLMKEIEKLQNEKHENKKDKQISDLQSENKKLREENERLQNLIQSTISTKEAEKPEKKQIEGKDDDKNKNDKNNDKDDYFGYKIDDVCNCYFCDKYLLKPTEYIKLFDRKQFIQNFHIIKKSPNYNEYNGMNKTFKISLNNFYAMKVLHFTPEDLSNSHTMMNMLKLFLREYEIMLYNMHPCILKTYGFNFGDTTHPPSMLIEYCPLNLKETAERMKKGRMVRFIVEIAYAMRFLHSNNFIHKNLTPENIMIDKNWNSKVSGFGYSNHLSDDETVDSSIEMIPDSKNYFLSPEFIEGKEDINEKTDVYSFGILSLFILTHGKFPSDEKFSEEEEGNEIVTVNDKIKIEIPASVNDNAKSLIKVCCKADPNERPSFDQILSFLKEKDYKIVNNYDSDHLKKRITEIELCEQS